MIGQFKLCEPIISNLASASRTAAFGSSETSEDCLNVNIVASRSAIESGEKLPIVYNIHGGGFAVGSNAFGTGYAAGLLSRGVMVISIGYRLGIRGFLYTPEPQDGAHANWGLLDQTAAMKWSQGQG